MFQNATKMDIILWWKCERSFDSSFLNNWVASRGWLLFNPRWDWLIVIVLF